MALSAPDTTTRPVAMVLRGLRGRCPRCGGGKLFRTWFSLKERCPTCCYKIDREPNGGFWLGAYVMNVVFGEGLLALYLLYFATQVIAEPEMAIQSWLVTALALAVLPPLVLWPISRTAWMAVDLLIHPMEPYEVADAELRCQTISSESRNAS